jgi:alpha-beta hydrolase superfamily lysophospholipase
MGEHTGRYHHVVERLNAIGLQALAWDLRGHGRSDGPRGDIAAYSVLLDDMAEIWAQMPAEYGPAFLYGHSLGGQITLNFAARNQPETAGLVITSPWLRLAFEPPRWKVSLANLAARVWPSLTQDTDVMPSSLSRDMAFLMAMPDPQLAHHRMSARMFHALRAGAEEAVREAAGLAGPMLLIHGAEDPITSVAATEEFFEALRSRDKKLVIIPEALHETHNDLCRERVLEEITGWLEPRLPPASLKNRG